MDIDPWLYQSLVDPDAEAADAADPGRTADAAGSDRTALLDLPPATPPGEGAAMLEELFATHGELQRVRLSVGGTVVGVCTREFLRELGAETYRGVGDGDGATLPGESARYRLLTYGCAVCPHLTYRVHIDERDTPRCPDGHGELTLR